MKRTAVILARILLLFTALTLVSGGKSIINADTKLHHIIADEEHTDAEAPDNSYSSLWDDLKWLDPSFDKPELHISYADKISAGHSLKTIDFPGFVWIPPKNPCL